MDYEVFIAERVANLRQAKGVSARDMSLSIGQNVNYVNHVENRKMEPSLSGLIYICEYFGITLQEFFDSGNPFPERLKGIVDDLKQLDDEALLGLSVVVKEMVGKKK